MKKLMNMTVALMFVAGASSALASVPQTGTNCNAQASVNMHEKTAAPKERVASTPKPPATTIRAVR